MLTFFSIGSMFYSSLNAQSCVNYTYVLTNLHQSSCSTTKMVDVRYVGQELSEDVLDDMYADITVSSGTTIDAKLTEESVDMTLFAGYQSFFTFLPVPTMGQPPMYTTVEFAIIHVSGTKIPLDNLNPFTDLFTVFWNGPVSTADPCPEFIDFTSGGLTGIIIDNHWCSPNSTTGIDEVCFGAANVEIGGKITYDHHPLCGLFACSSGCGVRNIEVGMYDATTDVPLCNSTTANDGLFSCDNLKSCEIRVQPEKDDNVDCGITIEDKNKLIQHLLGTSGLVHKWQFFAADANRSGHISVADASVIQHWINGTTPNNGDPWMFVPKVYYNIFNPVSQAPIYFEYIKKLYPAGTHLGEDFQMIKGGDLVLKGNDLIVYEIPSCDLCVATSFLINKYPVDDNKAIVYDKKIITPQLEEGSFPITMSANANGNVVDYTFTLPYSLNGFYLSLNIDDDKWEYIQDESLSINDANAHSLFDQELSQWRYIWVSDQLEGEEGNMVTLSLRKKDSSVKNYEGISIDDAPYTNYVVHQSKEHKLDLRINDESSTSNNIMASPNPFSDQINLTWLSQPQEGSQAIEVYNLAGKMIYKTELLTSNDQASYILDLASIQHKGMVMIRIKHNNDVSVIKLFKK